MALTLKDVSVGSRVKVVKVVGSGAVRRRIMDMGITKGIELYVRNCAPLGDPLELIVRGFSLALRREDAKMIEITINK
ncbi:MAG: ferrous iron transport protein A [Oscillospiraceae bacterium]|nr:ferrous iron transport protein A [Oscillospiraceae bacterium]